jgi:hypothetical protein
MHDWCAVQPAIAEAGPFGTKYDKALNIIVLVGLLLVFIGTCVGIGGELHRVTVFGVQYTNNPVLAFGWKSFTWQGSTQSFAACIAADSGTTTLGSVLRYQYCDTCQNGGRGFLAMTVFAFLGAFASLVRFFV